MKKEKIISELEEYFKSHCERYHLDMVFLYGSWARGYPRQESDIDLAIRFVSGLTDGDRVFSLITDISYALMLRLNNEVNIIPLFRDFRHPLLYYNAIILGELIFCRDPDQFLSLKLAALCQMEDFQIFGVPWQRAVAKHLLSEVGNA